MKFSPLFWPIQLKNNLIYILDETALPRKLAYIKAENYLQACKAIKDMKTRSRPGHSGFLYISSGPAQ
jgi:methylthioribose-1-phosphate isomerase